MLIRLPALYLSMFAHGVLLGLSALWLNNNAPPQGSKMLQITRLELPRQGGGKAPVVEPTTASVAPVIERRPEAPSTTAKPAVAQSPRRAAPLAAPPPTEVGKSIERNHKKHQITTSISTTPQNKEIELAAAAQTNPTTTRPQRTAQRQNAADPPAPSKSAETPAVPARNSAVANAMSSGLLQRYRSRIQSIIESHKTYPRAARRQGLEGTAIVAFSVNRDGTLREIELRTSSSHSRLDQAATNVLKGIERVDPIPAALPHNRLRFEVPLVYRLR